MPVRIISASKARLPKRLFLLIARAALGPEYKLTFAIVPPTKIKKLNLIYRGLNKPTDILSFPLNKKEGEIYICLSETRRAAKDFDQTYDNFLLYLFVHGCTHLKGYDHGSRMEAIERRLRRRFNIED